MKKICIFGFSPIEYIGGYEKFMIELADYLQLKAVDVEVTIVTFDYKIFLFIKKIIGFISFSYKKEISDSDKLMEKKINKNIKTLKINNLKSFLLLSNFDVIYSKNEIIEGLILFFLPKRPRIVVGVHTVHTYSTTDTFKSKIHNFIHGSLVYNFIWHYANSFHVINKNSLYELKKQFPNKKIFLAYNRLPNFIFTNNINITNFINITWVGRMTEQKGLKDLNSIIKNSKNKNIHWKIVGDGPDMIYLNDIGSIKNVNILGQKSPVEIADILNSSDYLLTTSKWEGFPYNILEACLCGNKIIGYNISGVNDIVDGELGFLFENKSQVSDFIDSNKINEKITKSKIVSYIKEKFSDDKTIGILIENILY